MKIAIGQLTTDPGRIEENCAKIIDSIQKARNSGARLIVFPELTIPGYLVLDLVYNRDFIDANLAALERVREASAGIAVIVGFIDRVESGVRAGKRPVLYNSAALIDDRNLIGVQDKSLLPNYGIFFEDRYFVPARKQEIFTLDGHKIGIEICEDLWDQEYPQKITSELVKRGASLIVNISASPFEIGKVAERSRLLGKVSAECKVPFLYVNLVGGFDGYEGEVVFDGHSTFSDSAGKVTVICAGFVEQILTLDTEQPPQSVLSELPWQDACLNALTLGIRDYFRRCGLKIAYLGLSGGIDSSLVACIACDALGAKNVIGVTMPSHVTSSATKKDAELLAQNLGIKCIERPIHSEFSTWLDDFIKVHNGREPHSITKQNKQARIRGSILMEYTNEERSALVLNTGNKTELALGYCTLYGDMCGGLSVIGDVSKARVYELCLYINSRAGRDIIPESVLSRVPTAELEVGQTDRANLPADYPVLSPLVDKIIEEDWTNRSLSAEYPEVVLKETLRMISMYEYKRRQAPPAIRITGRAFGVGRRIPIGVSLVQK